MTLLDEIGSNKYVEYALSFDRPYSISEVQNLLDKQNTEWLWLDTESDEKIDSINEQERNGEAGEVSSVETCMVIHIIHKMIGNLLNYL